MSRTNIHKKNRDKKTLAFLEKAIAKAKKKKIKPVYLAELEQARHDLFTELYYDINAVS